MGAIKYDFAGVPIIPTSRGKNESDEAWETRRRVYRGLYGDFERLGLPRPARPDHEITRDEVVAHLQQMVGDMVSRELANTELYDGFSDEQIARVIQRTGILHGVPYAPNLLSPADVAAARS
jgi:hypothetical protein